MEAATTYTAFAGAHRFAAGSLSNVTAEVRTALAGGAEGVIVFADDSGRAVDIDPREQPSEKSGPLADQPPGAGKPARGRPRLGVTAREVTLLPRHWIWLASQPGGASAALRRLVEQARRDGAAEDRLRSAREAAHRVLTTLAGDLAGYEDALRALYAGDEAGFATCLAPWPRDIRLYVESLLGRASPPDDH